MKCRAPHILREIITPVRSITDDQEPIAPLAPEQNQCQNKGNRKQSQKTLQLTRSFLQEGTKQILVITDARSL